MDVSTEVETGVLIQQGGRCVSQEYKGGTQRDGGMSLLIFLLLVYWNILHLTYTWKNVLRDYLVFESFFQ